MGPLAKVPCVKCLDNTSTPSAFLLTCKNCNKTWHHRCHAPPVLDSELVARIRAYNSGDFENGIAGWICRRCTKGKDRAEPPHQSSTGLNPIAVDSDIEQPTKSLRGQTIAKSVRAKSARSKPTPQSVTTQDTRPTYHDGASALGSRDLRGRAEAPVNRAKPPVPEVVDLTISSDEEIVQPPTTRPERPHDTRSQSRGLGQPIHPPGPTPLGPQKVQTPPSPQHKSPTPPTSPLLSAQVRAHIPNIPSPSPLLYSDSETYTHGIHPITPDTQTPPPPPPADPGPRTRQDPGNDIQPKPEPEPEPVLMQSVMTPWQAYNLAPSWILEGKRAANPWEESRAKQIASVRTLSAKRKPVTKHPGSSLEYEPLFNFFSTTWLRARDEKAS